MSSISPNLENWSIQKLQPAEQEKGTYTYKICWTSSGKEQQIRFRIDSYWDKSKHPSEGCTAPGPFGMRHSIVYCKKDKETLPLDKFKNAEQYIWDQKGDQ
jgi:hypothetical protein